MAITILTLEQSEKLKEPSELKVLQHFAVAEKNMDAVNISETCPTTSLFRTSRVSTRV